MNPFKRFSIYLWFTLKSLPPVSVGRLIMPTSFIVSWSLLSLISINENSAFVWAAVTAQTVQMWIMLPISIRKRPHILRDSPNIFKLTMFLVIATMFLQIMWSEPIVTHRIITVYCLVYGGCTLLGVAGDRDFQDEFAPQNAEKTISLAFRMHILKLRALTIFLILIVNELLVITQTELNTRVAIFAVLPVCLHYFFAIVLRLTHPPFNDRQ